MGQTNKGLASAYSSYSSGNEPDRDIMKKYESRHISRTVSQNSESSDKIPLDNTLPRSPRNRSRLSVRVNKFVRKLNGIPIKETPGQRFRPGNGAEKITSRNPLWKVYSTSSEDRLFNTPDSKRHSESSHVSLSNESNDSSKGEADTFISYISKLGGANASANPIQTRDGKGNYVPTPPKTPPVEGGNRAWTEKDSLRRNSKGEEANIENYFFSTLNMSKEQQIEACIKMLMSTINQHVVYAKHLNTDELLEAVETFVTNVSKMYTETSYHGFHHAVDVMQMMFLLINNFLKKKLLPEEPFFMLVIALCHDLGHQGANNAWLRQEDCNNLIQKYGDQSTLEKFHLDQAFGLMDKETLFSIEYMNDKTQENLQALMEDLIIATDMEKHDEIMDIFISEVKARKARKARKSGKKHNRIKSVRMKTWSLSASKSEQITLKKLPKSYLALAMKLCDIANVVRDFNDAKEWAKLLSYEFAAMGSHQDTQNPEELLKIQQQCTVPDLESLSRLTLGFMGTFALPMARAFEAVSPAASEFILTEMLLNMQMWLALVESKQISDSPVQPNMTSNEIKVE